MKCVVCKSSDIELRKVEEEIRVDKDIVLVPIEVLVCQNCGERYYDRKAMKKLEDIQAKARGKVLAVEDVGKVVRAKVA
ncbi:MAG: YgiT-type zinc finger protein [Bacteroidetes bacterium]|nr:YgiT-type zinc finger protein [Bacteroidota bacterium]